MAEYVLIMLINKKLPGKRLSILLLLGILSRPRFHASTRPALALAPNPSMTLTKDYAD
jgi:hypothetical protein